MTPNEHVQEGHIPLKTFETSQQGSYLADVTTFSPSTDRWLLSPSFLIPFTRFAAVLALDVCSELALVSFRVSRSLALLHSSLCFLSSSTSFCNCSQRALSCTKLANFWVYNLWVGSKEWNKDKNKHESSNNSHPCRKYQLSIMPIKGIVHLKKIVINYSPSYHSKLVRPLFIFRTQIKIFLMKSESFLTLHRQQGSYHVQGPERYQE